MSLFYSKVVAVLAKPSNLRSDFEIQQFLPWFSKKSDLFRSLKPILLLDVLKHCGFVKKVKDDIIIKQGEKGDCFFIILSGKVTIYINYAKTESTNAEAGAATAVQEQTANSAVPLIDQDDQTASEEDERKCRERNKIGTFVCSLGPGDTFGEVALLSEDCIRTASILADEPTDLIAIDRDLYNRSVKNFIAKEFEDKSNFIAASEYFSNWSPKYRKQLAMALRKETYNYDTAIVRQGNPVSEIYFVISGEVKITTNPVTLRHQYPNLCHDDGKKSSSNNMSELPHQRNHDRKIVDHEPFHSVKYKRPSPQRKSIDLCLLGRNEIIGDVEVLLDMDTYVQSAVCTQRTEVLVLEMKHYERLLVKRNPHAIEMMKSGLQFKLKHRFAAFTLQIPLLQTIVDMAAEFNPTVAPGGSNGSVTGRGDNKRPPSIHSSAAQSHHSSDTFSLPPRGPVIDLYGPGTVFHRIRTREKAKQKRKQMREKYQDSTQKSTSNVTIPPAIKEASAMANKQKNIAHRITVGEESFYELLGSSDTELSDLERRMKVWMGKGEDRLRNPLRFPCVTPDRIPIASKDKYRPRSHHMDNNFSMALEEVVAANK